MDLEKIEGLVKIIEDSSLNEFTYKDKDVKITMSKLDHPPVVAAGVPVAASAPVNTIVEKAEEEEEESLFITSPIVGTSILHLLRMYCFCKGGRSGKSRTDKCVFWKL